MTKKSDVAARQMIEGADPYLLIATLACCDADGTLLEEAMPYAMRGIADRTAADLPDDLRARLTERALAHLASGNAQALPPSDPRWRRIIDFAAGAPVPDEYVDMLMEEGGLWPRRLYQSELPPASVKRTPEVAIVGAGLSGIGLGVYLKKAGIPFTIYEKNPRPGGTWFDNRYPGCGVDTASHIYSFSFALNPSWKRYFSKQGDVLDYIETCIDRFDLRPHIRFDTKVSDTRYDEKDRRWRFATEAGGETRQHDADVLVSAVGQLNVPSVPRLKGLDSFKGEVVHTAEWRPEINYAGKRVALIGSGASAVQLGPSIAPSVAKLTAFQRSPQWLSSRPLYHQPVREEDLWLFENVKSYMNWYRMTLFWQFGDRLYPTLMMEEGPNGLRASAQSDGVRELFTKYIREKLADRPDLIEKVVPDYPPMAKRIPIDFGWFDMLKRDNVELVSDAIDHIEPDAVVTADGRRHEVDLIVLATGFEATRMLQTVPVKGRDGVELQKVWSGDDPRAYLGIMVPGFPNFFIMYGPNTNLGHGGSLIFQIECQARYVASAISHLASTGAAAIEVGKEACDDYNRELDQLLDRTVWSAPGVNNWFKNSRGRIATNSPWRLVDYWQKTRSFDPSVCIID
ncbi:NAD(P)/FAD-dependent oxidoreductase [Aquibium sp. LZ166]|uniref:NAD(P)/FAD-dependent oxidoreductase n=1 Tax=Aquibium pacificus TaxID=3153579 RepID=A0ABV3SS91_9HYPH